jgi:uncharacterized membrane protein (UPF0136 family)
MTVLYSSLMFIAGMLLSYYANNSEVLPIAPIISGNTFFLYFVLAVFLLHGFLFYSII